MTPSAGRVVVTALVAGLVLAGVGSAAAVPATASTHGVDAGALPDDPTDSTTNTTDSTDETADETTDSATETVENTTNATDETTDADDAVNETEETVVNETGDTVDETRDTVSDTVEETGDATDETTAEVENATGSIEDTTDTIENTTDTIENTANETALTAGTTGRVSVGTRLTAGTTDDATAESDAAADDTGGARTATGDADAESDGDVPGDADASGGDEAGETAAANAPGAEGGDGTGGAGESRDGPLPSSPGSFDPGPATGAGAVAAGGAAVALAGRRYGISPTAASSLQVDTNVARTFGRYAIERLREHGWRLLALFGYERYAGDPLDHDLRARIHEEIRADPGICLSAAAEAADAPLGTVRYHLKRLEAEGLIESAKSNDRRRYVPAGAEPDALETALREDAPRAVLEALFEDGPASTTELADRIDRDPSTATHHVERLADAGLVERERDGRAVESRLSDGTRAALARRRAGVEAEPGASAGSRPAATTD